MRGNGDRSMGNQLSAALLDLPVGPMHPERRLWAVIRAMSSIKQGGGVAAAEQLMAASSLSPAPLHAIVSKVGAINQRAINMVISNVPGVQMPLYAAGSRVLEMYPLLPLAPNTRLVVCALSYNHEMNIGLVADRAAVSDLEVFESGIRVGFSRLMREAGVTPARPRRGRAAAALRS
jgi:hypothetical protein